MRLIPIVGSLLVLATGAAAQTGPDRGACPTRYRDETQVDFLVRTRPVCEARWQDRVTAGTTGAETHEHFLERCGRRCAVVLGSGPVANTASAQYIPGGAALALIATGAAFAALSSDDKPASP